MQIGKIITQQRQNIMNLSYYSLYFAITSSICSINCSSVSISLTEKYILGAVGKSVETREFIKQLLLQIITFHSYEDVKLVFSIKISIFLFKVSLSTTSSTF